MTNKENGLTSRDNWPAKKRWKRLNSFQRFILNYPDDPAWHWYQYLLEAEIKRWLKKL